MPVACVEGVGNYIHTYLEYLRVNNPSIASVREKRGMICIEFAGSLTLSYEDYRRVNGIDSSRDYVERTWFLERVVQPAIATVRGARLTRFDADKLVVELADVRKTEVIHVRVTPEEKRMLEEEAEKHGMTLSDYVRYKLFGR